MVLMVFVQMMLIEKKQQQKKQQQQQSLRKRKEVGFHSLGFSHTRKKKTEKKESFTTLSPTTNQENMSLSRRACYKCGNIGHFAEACISSERLCYNCKQPGHESAACPQPRSSEAKQCYSCQGMGHVQQECPSLRVGPGAMGGGRPQGGCFNCGDIGHWARQCPNPPAHPGTVAGPGAGAVRPPFAGGRGVGVMPGRVSTCFKCGGPNHYARDCQAMAQKCYACGKMGHTSRECANASTEGKTCYTCGNPGHIAKMCPQGPGAVNGAASMDSAGIDGVGQPVAVHGVGAAA